MLKLLEDSAGQAANLNSSSPISIAWQAETPIGINLVPNGSFEVAGRYEVALGTAARTTDWAHSGDWSLRITPAGGHGLVFVRFADLTVGQSYVASVAYRYEGPLADLIAGVSVGDVEGEEEPIVGTAFPSGDLEGLITIPFTIPAGYPVSRSGLSVYIAGSHPLLIDSVMLTPAANNPAAWGVEFFNGDHVVTKTKSSIGLNSSWQGTPTIGAPWTELRRNHITDPMFASGAYLDSTFGGVTKTVADGQLILTATAANTNGVRATGANRIPIPEGKTNVTISATRQLIAPITAGAWGGRIRVLFFNAAGGAIASEVSTPLGANAAGVARMSGTVAVPATAKTMEIRFHTGSASGEVVAWSLPMIEFVGTLNPFFHGGMSAEGAIRYRYDGTVSVQEQGTISYAGGENETPSFLQVNISPAGMASSSAIPIKGRRADEIALYPLVTGVHESYMVLDGATSGATGKKYEITGYSTVYGNPNRAVPEQSRGIEVVYSDAPNTLATRTGVLSLGHSAATVPVPMGWNCTCRAVFEMPVSPKRFRIHYKNHDYLQDTLGTGTVSIHSTWLGEAKIGSDGAATGAFDKVPVQVAADNVFTNNGSDGVTDWIIPEQFAIERGVTYLLSYGVSFWTDGSISVGNSAGWLGGNLLNAGDQGVVGSKIWPLFDIWIEYDYIGTQPTLGVLGHSLNGAGNVDPENHPWDGEFQAWHQLWAMRNGGQTFNLNVGGSWTSNFPNNSPKWNFFDGTGAAPDMLALYTCSSDIAGGVPVADVKASVARLITKAKSKWGSELKILLFTEPGRLALEGNPATQAAMAEYNTWVRTKPSGVDYVIDTASLLSDPDDPTRLRPDLSADGEHYTLEGHKIIAREITDIRSLPGRYAPPMSKCGLHAPRTPHRLVFTSTKSSFKIRLWNGADAGCSVVWDSVAYRQIT